MNDRPEDRTVRIATFTSRDDADLIGEVYRRIANRRDPMKFVESLQAAIADAQAERTGR